MRSVSYTMFFLTPSLVGTKLYDKLQSILSNIETKPYYKPHLCVANNVACDYSAMLFQWQTNKTTKHHGHS